jgi:hypothetical protein
MTEIDDPDLAAFWEGSQEHIKRDKSFLKGYATSVWAKTYDVAMGLSVDIKAATFLEVGAVAVRALATYPPVWPIGLACA